jgi:hypothetical protein
LLTVAAVITAVGIIWVKMLRPVWLKAVRPISRLAVLADEAIPLLRELIAAFRETPPGAFAVLDEIARQFRTDSGSSLLDIVNRIDAAAKENSTVAEVLAAKVEAVKRLTADDRAQDAHDRLVLNELDAGMARLVMTVERIETAVTRIEENGASG